MINHLLSKSNTNEVIGGGTMVGDVVDKSDYKDDNLIKFRMKLEEGVKELSTANDRKKKSDDTEIVDSLEELREDAFKSFTFTVRGFKLRADKDLSAKGHQIFEIIKRHGLTLYKLPDNEQTAKTISLVDELKKPANMAAMENTILMELFSDVESSNKNYVDGVAKRAKNDAEAEETALVVAARKKTKLALNHMVNYLNSVSFINDSAELKSLCKSIASIIDKTNANIHGRMKRGNNTEETVQKKES